MTEYDYSPEAYQRYLATQQRISKWVDKTEGCRSQFANALSPPPSHRPGSPTGVRVSPHRRSPDHLRTHRSRSPSPDSSGEDPYEHSLYAPGPMPPMRSAPGHTSVFPQRQLPPLNSPLASPPLISPRGQMPPSYYGTPSLPQLKARQRSQAHAQQYQYPPPPLMLSPPASPGIFPHPGSPTGFAMMVPQQPIHMMSHPVPSSAPAHIMSFTVPPPPPAPSPASPTGYFQTQSPQAMPSFGSFLSLGVQIPYEGVPIYAYSTSSAMVTPPHSAYPSSMQIFTPMVSPHLSAYSDVYPQVAVASPTTPGTSPYSYIYPSTSLHQRVYDMTGQDIHTLRRSIG